MAGRLSRKLRVLDLFSGIGGFSLGLERTGGFETVAFCEIDPFCRAVLAKHWPNVRQYEDVRTLTADTLARDGIGVDVITGGFPCQDISVAGKQAGISDGTRSGLWSEIARLVGELRPQFVIVENVANLLSGPSDRRGGWFGRVLGDLAECGYDAEWENIPASALGAPHRRERVWIVAYAQCIGRETLAAERRQPSKSFPFVNGEDGIVANPAGLRLQGVSISTVSNGCGSPHGRANELAGTSSVGDAQTLADAEGQGFQRWENGRDTGASFAGFRKGCRPISGNWSIEPNVGRVAHGVPQRVDRLKSLGNAVVPQIPELIGRAILASESEREAA